MANATCATDGCDSPPRSPGSKLCAKCYHRQYRHGDVTKTAARTDITASAGRRYKTVHRPDHPLAFANGNAYVHRVVLYDKIGPGSHPCHWCGKTVRWEATRGDSDCLNTDHLNGIGDDNHADNLVPSCTGCNNARALQARSAALRAAGWWSANDTVAKLATDRRRPPVVPHQVVISDS